MVHKLLFACRIRVEKADLVNFNDRFVIETSY